MNIRLKTNKIYTYKNYTIVEPLSDQVDIYN